MICPSCNREIPDGSNICGYCSADLRNMGGYNGMQQGYTPPNQYQSGGQYQGAPYQGGGYVPGPVQQPPQQPGGSGFGTGGRFKLQITPRGLMVLGGIVVVLVLLIWLLVTIFGGGSGADPNTAMPNITQPTPLNYQIIGTTAVPEGYVPPETPNPLDNLSLTVTATATPVATALPTFEKLGKGDKGPEVEMLQTRLKYFGFLTGDVDGQYGPATAEAVKAFQEGANLAVDGVAGNETLRTLYSLPYDPNEAAANPDGGGASLDILQEKPDIPG